MYFFERNFAPETIHIWYEDGKGGLFQGQLDEGAEYTINTYEGHHFFFTSATDKTNIYGRWEMNKEQVTYAIFHPTKKAKQSLLDHHQAEMEFSEEYFKRMGIKWRHYFGPDGPRSPPVLFQWPASEIGEIHHVETTEGHWVCAHSKNNCQYERKSLELEVVSLEPRIFVIKDFLSEFEADQIIGLAQPKVKESEVGSLDGGGIRKSDTRTSRNTWIPRRTNYITESLALRAADVLQIDEKLLGPRNAEDLQVVHYVIDQK